MKTSCNNRERGSLLLIVLLVLLLFTGLIIGVVFEPIGAGGGRNFMWGQGWIRAVVSDVFQTKRKIDHTATLYLAEAGCEHAKQWLSAQADLGSAIIRTVGTIPAATILGASSISMGRGYYTTQIAVSSGAFGIPYYTITSTGNIDPDGAPSSGDELRRTTVVKAILGSFARYAYFTNSEPSNIWFISSDVLLGLVHTNGSLHMAGKPDFWGMASQVGSTFTFYNNGSSISTSNPSNPPLDVPNFRDGYRLSAPSVPYPTNATDMETAAQGEQGLVVNSDSEITLSVGAGDVGQLQYTQQEEQQVWHDAYTEYHSWRYWHVGIYHSYSYSQWHTHPGEYVTEDVTVTHSSTVFDGQTNPSGKAIIYVNGDAEVSGTLAGQLTILTQDDLIVTDDILYHVDPVDYDGDGLLSDADGDGVNDPAIDRTGDGIVGNNPGEAADDADDTGDGVPDATGYDQPASTDTLGLVAKGNVIVANDGGPAIDRKISGSIMALGTDGRAGKFTVEDYSSHLEGTLTVVGGLVQKQRGAIGTFSGSIYGPTITSGYAKNYIYDKRLLYYPPPYFPPAKAFDLIYWQEVPQ